MNKKLAIIAIACTISIVLGGFNSSILFGTQYLSTKEGYSYTVGEAADWWDCNWSYAKKIIIDHTKVQSDQTDFPVLIYNASDTDLAAYAQDDGDDIVFVDSNNLTQYDHELEKFDGSTGELVAWVEISSLRSSADTILYMYYGNPDCSNQQNVVGTWNSGFKNVHHLQESSGTHEDSTSNNNDGTCYNGVSQDVTGRSVLDGADSFDGIDDYVDCGTSSSLNITGSLTLEAWVQDPPLKFGLNPGRKDVKIVDKKHEKIRIVPGKQFTIERTITADNTDVVFVALLSPGVKLDGMAVDSGSVFAGIYHAGQPTTVDEQTIENTRILLPNGLKDLEIIAYSKPFKIQDLTTIQMCFETEEWYKLFSNGKISYLVISSDGKYDFEATTHWHFPVLIDWFNPFSIFKGIIDFFTDNTDNSDTAMNSNYSLLNKYNYIKDENKNKDYSIPKISNNCLGEKISTASCFLRPLSPENIGQLNFNAKARYGESLKFNSIASINLSENLENEMNSIWSIIDKNVLSNSSFSNLVNDTNLFIFVSDNKNSGAINSNLFKESLCLNTVNVIPLLINAEMITLASATRSIYVFSSIFLYLFASERLTSSANFFASSSVNLLLDSIFSTSSNNCFLCFSLINSTFASSDQFTQENFFNSDFTLLDNVIVIVPIYITPFFFNSSNFFNSSSLLSMPRFMTSFQLIVGYFFFNSLSSLGADMVNVAILVPPYNSVCIPISVDVLKSFVDRSDFDFKLPSITETYELINDGKERTFIINDGNKIKVESATKEDLPVVPKHKVYAMVEENKKKNDSLVNIVMMPELIKDNCVFFNFKYEDKTSNMNPFVVFEIPSKILEMFNENDVTINNLIHLLSNGNCKYPIFLSKLIKRSSQVWCDDKFKTHFRPINSSKSFEFICFILPDLSFFDVSSIDLTTSLTTEGLTSLVSSSDIPDISRIFFFNCSSFMSFNTSKNACLATDDQLIQSVLDISFFKLSGTDNVIVAIFDLQCNYLYYVCTKDIFKSFVNSGISGFKLLPIVDTYELSDRGKELLFLDEDGNEIPVKSITKEYCAGNIYDVNVLNDIIVLVKRDNGSPFWSGNSDTYVYDWSGRCYDNETEGLTEEEQKLFSELGDERVATLNQETQQLEWQKPVKFQEFDYDKEMYKIELEDGSELRVSKKHMVYVSSSVSVVMTCEGFKDESITFHGKSQDKMANVNPFEMAHVSPKIFEMFNIRQTHFCELGNLSIFFNFSTNSFFKGNSSTGCQSMDSQNFSSSLVNFLDLMYRSNISLFIVSSLPTSDQFIQEKLAIRSLKDFTTGTVMHAIYISPLARNLSKASSFFLIPSLNTSGQFMSGIASNLFFNSSGIENVILSIFNTTCNYMYICKYIYKLFDLVRDSSELHSSNNNNQETVDSNRIKSNVQPFFINAANTMLASTTSFIYANPCLLAMPFFTSSANLSACFFVNLLFERMSRATENSNSSINSLIILSNATSNLFSSLDGTSTVNLNSVMPSTNSTINNRYLNSFATEGHNVKQSHDKDLSKQKTVNNGSLDITDMIPLGAEMQSPQLSPKHNTVHIGNKKKEYRSIIPNNAFTVERTITSDVPNNVIFVALYSPGVLIQDMKVEDTSVLFRTYTAGLPHLKEEQEIENIRKQLPTELQQLPMLAYSKPFSIYDEASVQMQFNTTESNGILSDGRISYLVIASEDIYDYEFTTYWNKIVGLDNPFSFIFDFFGSLFNGGKKSSSKSDKNDDKQPVKELILPPSIRENIERGEATRVIVRLEDSIDSFSEKTDNLENHGFIKTAEIESVGVVSGYIDASVFENIKNNPGIEGIYPDDSFNVLLSESLPLIDFDKTFEAFHLTGDGIKICMLDTGVNSDVVDYSYGYDFVNDDSDPSDDNGHGTRVAAVLKNIAPDCELVVAKVLDSDGTGFESDVLEGLSYCIDQQPDIILFSIGSSDGCSGFCDTDFVAAMCNDAADNGIFIVAASGNDGSKRLTSPACGSKVFSVGATDDNDNIAGFSNVNPTLDMFAPGVDITTIAGTSSGTSMSAPHVAAAAALILEYETFDPTGLYYRLRSTGRPINYVYNESLQINISRLNIYNAVVNDVTMEPYNYSWWWQGYMAHDQGYETFEATSTYEFNSYDAGEAWETSPQYMVDGNENFYAGSRIDEDVELCDGNTCPGTNLGAILTVEIRAKGYSPEALSMPNPLLYLRPVFTGGDGNNHQFNLPLSAGWSSWYDITTDTNVPSPWTWNDVVNLDCDVEVDGNGLGRFTVYCSKVEIQVTYYTNLSPVFSGETPSNESTDISVETAAINVTIEDPDGDTFNWTIETSPDVGSDSGNDESDGSKTCSISGLEYNTTYTWYVNATDGGGDCSGEWTNESYWFTTTATDPPKIIMNSPSNGSGFDSSVMLNVTVEDDLGWNMTVKFYGDGSLINTTNTTENETVTYNWSCSGGIHTWNVTVNETINTNNSETRWFSNHYFNDTFESYVEEYNSTYPGAPVTVKGDSYVNFTHGLYNNTVSDGLDGTERTINASMYTSSWNQGPSPRIVFINDTHGYAFGGDTAGSDQFSWWKTIDGGTTWTGPNIIDTATGDGQCTQGAVWYDKWTPGDLGTKIHITVIGQTQDELKYNYFDTSTETTRGSWVTIHDMGTWYVYLGGSAICKATDGKLWAGGFGNSDAALKYSDDNGATWTDKTPGEYFNYGRDDIQLLPLPQNDVMCIYYDYDTTLRYTTYDSDTSTWSSFSTIDTNSGGYCPFGASMWKKTGDIYLAIQTNDGSATGDIVFWKYTVSNNKWLENINPLEANAYGYDASVVVSQGNGDIYVFYEDGSSTLMDIYCQNSTDNGTTWSTRQQISTTTDDTRYTTGNFMSYDRLYASWHNEDLNDWIGTTLRSYTLGDKITDATGNVTSVNITKPDNCSWDRLNVDINNTDNSTFSILNGTSGAVILSGLDGQNNNIGSVTANPIKIFGEFNATLSMDSWNVSWVNNKPTIEFIDPTPADGSTTSNTWAYLNTTITDASNTSAFFDWNNSLVGYWAMDFYNSTHVFDNSTYKNNGSFQGGLSTSDITTGKYGDGLEFDGDDDYLDMGNPADDSLDIGTDDMSFSLWMKRTGSGTGSNMLFSKRDYSSGTNPGYQIQLNSGKYVNIYFCDGSANRINIASTTDLMDSNWHHIVVVFDRDADATVYVDGSFDASGSISAQQGNVDSPEDLRIGLDYVDASDLDGIVDEVRIHRRSLGWEEINASYNNSVHRLHHNFTGLSDGTYNYSAYAIDAAGNLNITATRNVTIDRTPTVVTNASTGVEETNATLNGYLSNNGGESCTVRFEYGTTTSYGTNTSNQTKTIGDEFSASIPTDNVDVLYERYNGDVDEPYEPYIYDENWLAQTFTIGTTGTDVDHYVTSVKLYLTKGGNPGTVTVSIQGTSGGLPDGTDLTSGTTNGDTLSGYEWREITLTPFKLSASTQYAIVVGAPDGDVSNAIGWMWHSSNPYAGGNVCTSDDGGGSWTDTGGGDCLFEEYGNLIGSSLLPGTLYHYRAYANNSVGSDTGDDMAFLTKPNAPTGLTAATYNQTRIDLSWTKGTGANNTYIVRTKGGYPSDRTDGTNIYNDTGTSYSDTGLDQKKRYYYRAWSYTFWTSDGTTLNQWSDDYVSATAATTKLTLINCSTDKNIYAYGETVTFTAWIDADIRSNVRLLLATNISNLDSCSYSDQTSCIAYSDATVITTQPQQITATTTTTSASTTWYAKACDDSGRCSYMYENTSAWNKTYHGGNGADIAYSVATDSNDNVYVVGRGSELNDTASAEDWWIMKFNSNGVRLWNKTYDDGENEEDVAHSVATDSNNNVYVVGYGMYLNASDTEHDWWIKKFDSDGNEDTANWNKTYQGCAVDGSDGAYSVATDSNDNVYVVGHGQALNDTSSGFDWWIMKFDSSGDRKWNKTYTSGGDNNDIAYSVAIDSNDNVYVVGAGRGLNDTTSKDDIWIMKFDSDGDRQWNKTYDATGENDCANSVAVDSNDNVYVVGYGYNLNGSTNNDWWIMKFDSSGNRLFNKTYDGTGNDDKANSVSVDSNNNTYVVGYGASLNGSTNNDWWLKKFNSTGVEDTTTWNNTYDGKGGHDAAYSVTNDTNGNIYTVGYGSGLNGSTSYDWWIKKFEYFTGSFTTVTDNKQIISKTRSAYSLEVNAAADTLYGYVKDTSVSTSIDTSWHYVALTYDGSGTLTLYKDGESRNTASPIGSITTNAETLKLGRYLSGYLDELRISNTVRSASWINTTYLNTNDPEAFATFGSQKGVLSTWTYRKKITINSSMINQTLANYPLLVYNSSDTDLRDNALSNGNDIIFLNSSASANWQTETWRNKLDHEIEKYDSSTGELVAWVRIPTLSSTTDTEIYMYYNNSLCNTNKENVTGVWDSNYKMVQHLQETPANDTAGHLDSTSNDNDGTPKNFNGTSTSTTSGVGKIDGADVFDELDDYVQVSADNSIDAFGKTTMTVSAWIYPKSDGEGDYGRIVGKSDVPIVPVGNGYEFATYSQADGALKLSSTVKHETINNLAATSDTISINSWHHVVFVYNENGDKKNTIYLDGELASLSNDGAGVGDVSDDTSINLRVGNYADDTTYTFNGTIDEVRISNTARNSSWINTTYNNTNDPANFTTFGSQTIKNEAPVLSSPSPSDDATGQDLNSTLSITVADINADSMNVTFRTNATGSWGDIGSNDSVYNGTYSQTNSSMNSYDTTYYWSVNCTDGSLWTNATYSFTTKWPTGNVSGHYSTVKNENGTYTITFQPNEAYAIDTFFNAYTTVENNNYGDDIRLLSSGCLENTWTSYGQVTLLNFSINVIPSDTSITSAVLRLYQYDQYSGWDDVDLTLNAYRMLVEWDEMEVTAFDRTGSEQWGSEGMTSGVDYAATENDSATGQASQRTNTWWNWTGLDTLVQDWIDGTYTNYGVAILSKEPSQYKKNPYFRSANYADDESLRPKLEILYTG